MSALAMHVRDGRRHLPHARLPVWAWIVIVTLCGAAVLPVVQSSNATETGARLVALEAERERMRSEIRHLSAHVGELASLSRVELHARGRLRMVDATPTVTVEVERAPPARVVPSRFLPTSEPVERHERPRWQALLDVLIIE